ncbi:metalloendopeptidase [Plakobranchus ocellatus]|uniref:Metalloendopeptidase n=1 Tax=Plakobranchus ocellatus TaxID=259542 RepID=A0AAV4CVF8_9GAST|nr:metalloendopeptidase [Plakobranchus ocellatus]
MFCCNISMPEQKEETPVIVDLSEILRDKAWLLWHSSFSWLQKRRWKRHHFDIEVPQNYYVFEDVTSPQEQRPLVSSNNNFDVQQQVQRQQPQMGLVTNAGKQAETVTIDTKFDNGTGEKQTYKFRFEKTRRTDVTVSFQKGFTFGTTTSFKVGLPQILGGETGVEAGASTEYQVTNSKGQTFEESVVMEATSDIVVDAHKCYVADVKLQDIHVMKPFRSTTRMRLPQGYAPVYIKRKSDGKQVSVYKVRNLKTVFGNCSCVKTSTAVPEAAGETTGTGSPAPKYDGKWIDFITEGYVEGTFASNHEILLRNVDRAL